MFTEPWPDPRAVAGDRRCEPHAVAWRTGAVATHQDPPSATVGARSVPGASSVQDGHPYEARPATGRRPDPTQCVGS